MRVLVTGWAGYIGPVLVRRLRAAGHYVIGWDLGIFLPQYVEPPEWPDKVRFVDIRDADLWPERVDAVVHLAGLSNDPMGNLDADLTHAINVNGTLGVFDNYRNSRHVVVSSCSVYGTSKMATEDDTPAPLTHYAMGKAAVDKAVQFAVTHDEDAVCLRLGTVYGYSPGHRLDLVVNRMSWDAVNTGYVRATGNAARPLTHIEDVASAVLFMLDRPETGIYNVVGENYRMHDLARAIARYAATDAVLDPPGADQRDYMADGSKLRALGWESQHTVAGSLPVLMQHTITLPPRTYERLPALRALMQRGYLDKNLRHQEAKAA